MLLSIAIEITTHSNSSPLSKDDFDRLKIISGLKAGGTLLVEVRMRKVESTTQVSMPFVPENPLTKTILSKFNDETSSNI